LFPSQTSLFSARMLCGWGSTFIPLTHLQTHSKSIPHPLMLMLMSARRGLLNDALKVP